jgi:hypothetical protein
MSIINRFKQKKVIFSLLLIIFVGGIISPTGCQSIISRGKSIISGGKRINQVKAGKIARRLYDVGFCKKDCDGILEIILRSVNHIDDIEYHENFILLKGKIPDYLKKLITSVGEYSVISQPKITKYDGGLLKIEENEKKEAEKAAEKAVKDALARGVKRQEIQALKWKAADEVVFKELVKIDLKGTDDKFVSFSRPQFNKIVDSVKGNMNE